jgi:Sulfotransferase family
MTAAKMSPLYVFLLVALATSWVGPVLVVRTIERSSVLGTLLLDSNGPNRLAVPPVSSSPLPRADASEKELQPKPAAPPSLGRRIVNAAFQQGYADFVRMCPRNSTLSLRECMLRAQKWDRLPEHAGRRWPWWLRNMMRDGGKHTTGLHGGWHELQYEDPLNIRQCVLEKVGTKNWQNLYSAHHDCPRANATFPHAFTQCYKWRPRRPGSSRAVFLRDPLDRFLSGFLDKCGRAQRDSQHCEPRSVMIDADSQLVTDQRGDMVGLFEIYVDVVPLSWNLHFFPQALYCDGLYRYLGDYEFVGNLGDDFPRHLRRFIERYPQLEGSARAVFPLLLEPNATSTDDAPRTEMGGAQNVAASGGATASSSRRTGGVETGASSLVESIYTPHSLRRVLEYTAIDYVMLDLPIPDWAEQMLLREEKSHNP